MKNDEAYDEIYEDPRTDFKYLWIVVKVILALIAIILILFALRCEPTDYSSGECCWWCIIQTTYYYPDRQPYEFIGTLKYELCDKTDEQIKAFETQFTYNGFTEDSIKFKQVATCRK